MQTRFLRAGFVLLACASTALATPQDTDAASPTPAASVSVPPPPPAPEPPKRGDFATPQEEDAARRKWSAEMRAWRRSLTPEQRAAIKQQQVEQQQRSREETARAQRLPQPDDNYSWRDVVAAHKLTPEEIEQLERQQFTYGRTVRQSFYAYLGGPVFITTDSLLNGFHVLLEDSFREHELAQVDILRTTLAAIIQRTRTDFAALPQPPPETLRAWEHVQRVVGPALCLLGEPLESFDEDCRREIQRQLKRINAAERVELPEWLAPGTDLLPAIDYRRCKPVGFYTSDPRLADYFRAVRWLQMVPFRAERELELEAILLLGSHTEYEEAESKLDTARLLLGSSADLGIREAKMDFQVPRVPRSAEARARLLAWTRFWILRRVVPHDTLELWSPEDYPAELNAELGHIQYFVLTGAWLPDTELFQQMANADQAPHGLAVAGWLGSDFALDRCSPGTRDLLTRVQASHPAAGNPRKDYMPSTLYADYLGVLRSLFVPPPAEAPAFVRSAGWQAKTTQTALASWAQMRHTFTLQASISQVFLGVAIAPAGFIEPNPEFFTRMADLAERGRTLLNQNPDRWAVLVAVTRRLEALVHKQLRGEPWNPSEDAFLRDYGKSLAAIMGYRGSAYWSPRDDAPRWAEVHWDQQSDQGLAVATGRPRLLHVLYPWNGLEILCTGSVMPYHEYWTKHRLTDEEWLRLLDSPESPRQPEWLAATLPEAERPE